MNPKENALNNAKTEAQSKAIHAKTKKFKTVGYMTAEESNHRNGPFKNEKWDKTNNRVSR